MKTQAKTQAQIQADHFNFKASPKPLTPPTPSQEKYFTPSKAGIGPKSPVEASRKGRVR
jgi:hypothetical protein